MHFSTLNLPYGKSFLYLIPFIGSSKRFPRMNNEKMRKKKWLI